MADDAPAKKKSAITISEAFIMWIMSVFVMGLWKDTLSDLSVRMFGKNKLMPTVFFTAVLAAMLMLFKNVDIGRSSLYEFK